VDLQTFEAMLAPNSQQLLARIEPEYDGDNALTVSARFRRADRSLVAACQPRRIFAGDQCRSRRRRGADVLLPLFVGWVDVEFVQEVVVGVVRCSG
jgi:hypothetical protein